MVVSDYRALISGQDWLPGSATGRPVVITYAFLNSREAAALPLDTPYPTDGYFAFNATQQASFRRALLEAERVAGVMFVEVDDPGDAMIDVARTQGSAYAGWAYLPFETGGELIIEGLPSSTFGRGSYGYEVILHELGHALGLKHPFEGDPVLAGHLDNENSTLMSYTSNGRNDTSFARLDIDALVHLYGSASGVAGWTAHVNAAADRLHIVGSARADRIQAADFTPISYHLRGGAGNDTVWGGATDDTLLGDGGNDRLIAAPGRTGSGNDRLLGGSGNDSLSGGSGRDLLYGGDDDDAILGRGPVGDRLYGGGGADSLRGGAGVDHLFGGDGADRLFCTDAFDFMTGGGGRDVFHAVRVAGARQDVLDFEDGLDRISGFIPQARLDDATITEGPSGVTIDYLGAALFLRGMTAAEIDIRDFV